MKQYLLATIILFCCLPATAQTDFIQPGAEWHYGMKYGSFRQNIVSDTLYHGKMCKRIRREGCIESFYFYLGFRVNQLRDLYVYNTPDTVFIYNEIFEKFTPLYVFNVNAGDTIYLPIIPPEGGSSFQGSMGDSTFGIVIDSVKTEIYDTAHLKTVYSTPLNSTIRFSMDYGGPYTWNIGSRYGFIPSCIYNCVWTLSDNSQPCGELRCYHDNNIALKYTSGDCQLGVPQSILANKLAGADISIVPTPASDEIRITNNSRFKITGIELYGTDSRLYRRYKNNVPVTIDVSSLSPAVYIIRFSLENDMTVIKKLVVAR